MTDKYPELFSAMRQVNEYMEVIAHDVEQDEITGQVLRDATASRGKMLRPQLLYLCAVMTDERKALQAKKRLCRWGAIIELAHMTSLIHDDVIDESPLRRGRETLHKRYGNSTAIYAGDYLLARLLRTILEGDMNQIALELAGSVEQMCRGEIGQSRCRYRPDTSVEAYERNIYGKTGVMFEVSCKTGVLEIGGGKRKAEAFAALGRNLGRAFQLRDDLLDFLSDEQAEGKQVLKDFREGIFTMPVLLTRNHPVWGKEMRTLMEKSKDGILEKSDMDRLRELVHLSGAIRQVTDMVNHTVDDCGDWLTKNSGNWAAEAAAGMINKLRI